MLQLINKLIAFNHQMNMFALVREYPSEQWSYSKKLPPTGMYVERLSCMNAQGAKVELVLKPANYAKIIVDGEIAFSSENPKAVSKFEKLVFRHIQKRSADAKWKIFRTEKQAVSFAAECKL